jgi:hypothetical protein
VADPDVVDEPPSRVDEGAGALTAPKETRTYAIPWGSLGSRVQRILYVLSFWIIGPLFFHGNMAAMALFLPIGALIAFSLRGLEVNVGDDGVIVAGVFFSYDRVIFEKLERARGRRRERRGPLRIELVPDYLHLYIPSGRTLALSFEDSTVRELEADLRARILRYDAQPDPAEIPAALVDSAKAQIHTLREQLSATSYRAGAITADVLWRVAENPRATPRTRVAAVATLTAQASSEDRARLRVLATSTADDDTRAMLRLAAEGDRDDELLASLEEAPRMRSR